MALQEQLETMLARGDDGPLLRFTLGELYYKNGDPAQAAMHLDEAVRQDAAYSAAWKLYGQALMAAGDSVAALETLEQGIAVAEANGDNQAAREMQVFAKRARRDRSADDS